MLSRLCIENYILIEKLELDFASGLNIITGETGAGKSILLGALGMILGNRADSAVALDKQRNCVVEAEFDIEGLELGAVLDQQDIDDEGIIVIRRIVTPQGRSRAFINDIPVQLSYLKELSSYLIDIHSQHQNLILSSENFRMKVLDGVALNGELLENYKLAFGELKEIKSELKKLRESVRRDNDQVEWLRFQLAEFDRLKLKEGEVAELEGSRDIMEHSAEIAENLAAAEYLLDEEEEGVLSRIKKAAAHIEKISAYLEDPELASRLASARVELKDITAEIGTTAQNIHYDPVQLERITGRLDAVYSLMHKHKAPDQQSLTEIYRSYREQLEAIENFSEKIAALENRHAGSLEKTVAVAAKLTQRRNEAAQIVSSSVQGTLSELGMPAACFHVEITPRPEPEAEGMDKIRFMFSPADGIPLSEAEKTASGGEISRLMLALKSLAARTGKLPTIIFDEIDTGISGRIADAMGRIIHKLSAGLQVINITHLPQVAAKGNNHYVVVKEQHQGKPRTTISLLSPDQRVMEIASMLSGSRVTDAALEQARQLLSAD